MLMDCFSATGLALRQAVPLVTGETGISVFGKALEAPSL
jgi:hypothetical protein